MSSQSQGDSTGSSSGNEQKRPNQGRRGVYPNRAHHGRTQTGANGKEDGGTSAQKRIRNLQQKSHERSSDYKLRPQTGKTDHNREPSKALPQRSTSGPVKSKGNPLRKGQSSQSESDKKSPRENGLAKSTSKDIKRGDRKDSGIGCSPTSVDPHNALESTDTSGVELSSGGPADSESEEQEAVPKTEDSKQDEAKEQTSSDKACKYTRDELLTICKSPASQRVHPALVKSMDHSFLKSSPYNKQSTELSSEQESKRKYPTALSLIKEHDAKQLPKVSLSPQRKSFHDGCSWKENKPRDSPPSSAKEFKAFEFDSPSKANQQQGHPQSKHKVIDHIPLRDQEMGRGDKKNWRDRSREPEWAKDDGRYHNTWDEEPEWMEFGPNDRFELIELKGLDEHEREREARLGREEGQTSPPVNVDAEDPLPHDEQDPEEVTPSDKVTPGDKSESEPVSARKAKESAEEAPKIKKNKSVKSDVMLKAALEMDNEFMLDGFDFSTGLSFCQALDDEEEVRSTQSADMGNALMKMLKIRGEEKQSPNTTKPETNAVLGVSSRPVNALTLDEIHARENIPATPTKTTPSQPSSEDLGAFNKLIAGLQSSGALQQETAEVKSKPTRSTPTSISPIPMPPTSVPVTSSVSVPIRPETVQPPQNTFGNILEKEMDFDEEVITGAHPHYQAPPPPNIPPQYPSRGNSAFSRVEHLERMLEKLDQNMMQGSRHKPLPPENPHMAGYPEPYVKKVTPGHRMNPEAQRPMHPMEREYVYPEEPPRIDMMPPPNIGIRPQGGVHRSSANNWAVEMERRRLFELKQMERARAQMERDRMYGNNVHGPAGPQHKMPPPKPNISLLPTAVMRQMHNSKPNQSLSEVTKTSSAMATRMDQDPHKSSMTHSPISFNEQEPPPQRMHLPHMYQMGGGQMRGVPPLRPVSDPAAAAMMYQRGYYNMPVMPHGMQNPYMY